MMEIINLDENYIHTYQEKSAVAIGKFDGIHIGHKKLLSELIKYKKKGYKTIVFSFERSIIDFLKKERSQTIAADTEKLRLIEECGADILAIYPVNQKSVNVLPESFIEDYLVKKLNAGIIVAGTDCSFGRFGKGNIALLKELEGKYSYLCEVVDKVTEPDGQEISSSYVKQKIVKGDMEHVARLLDRPYSFTGTVCHGQALGRTIDMPTANIYPEESKILPPYGVYFSEICLEKRIYKAVTNIGVKPTVSEDNKPLLESFIFDFNQDIYDKEIEVRLLKYSRGEMKFDNIESLKKQMNMDIVAARAFHHI